MVVKLSIVDTKSQNYGLWYHPEFHGYSSPVFNVSSFKPFKGQFQIVMYKNKFHKQSDDRPSYQFKFAGRDVVNALDVEFEDNTCQFEEHHTVYGCTEWFWYSCSNCGEEIKASDEAVETFSYCPYCGKEVVR